MRGSEVIPRRTGNALCALLLVALPALAAGEAMLSASTDVRELPLDDTLVLRITAKFASRDESGELDIPVFADFDVVSRARSEQMSFSFGGGASSMARTVITELTLTPKRAGDLTIEPVKLEYRGKKIQTEPIAIHVLPAGQAAPGGGGPDARADAADPFADVHPGQRDLLLRAAVDDDHPFVGQQVTYSLFLLARTNVSSIEKLVSPRLDGFWSVDVEAPQQLVPEQRILDGVPYTSYLLRRRALFPLRAGRATIDPAEVQVLTGFGMLFSRGTSRRSSQPLQIEVQPLPPGKPPGFDAGNVGQWTLTATADPAAVGVGQPITFRLVASGRGNVRDLRLPKLPEIPGVRAYDATTSDKESIERGRVNGTRTIEQLLVPERTGALEIPALSMDVFDPVLKQYRTLKTERIPLRVTPAEGAQAAAASVSQNLLSAGGVRPIRLRLSTVDRAAPPWTQPWFWPLLGIPPFGVAVGLGFAGLRRLLQIDPGEKRVKLARGAAAKRLKGARALLQRGEALAFYAEVARAVTGYLLDKQGIAAAGLTREELAAALRARGHGEETVRRLVRVLDDCDRARFAPGSGEAPAREAMLGRADQVLNELDRGRA
ncbi:MAG TPA: BatD family protein [Myxococcales bacterium]|nr:BatD family protein [Myxococcales bacterium]